MFFKQNVNKQILNTEIRVYLEHNIAVMTNFSEYTHNLGEKQKFIAKVLSCVSTFNNTRIEPLKFSDLCLRYLLTISKKIPSKFKFEVEGRLKIGIDVKHPSIDDPLKHDEVKYFYDKYQLSLLKVVLSEAEEKYLTIDGAEGKLISKSQNLDISDIDVFINRLSGLLKYDYLNDSYDKEIRNMATRELVGTSYQKNIIVNNCYTTVENRIKELMSDGKGYTEYITTIRNAFFFCIKNNIFYDTNDIKYCLEGKTADYIARIAKRPISQINKLFSSLMEIAIENEDNLEDFIILVDTLINDKRMVCNAVGS